MIRIAQRVQKIQPSLTLAVSARAAALKAKGIDVIAFGVGEPDFDTPDNIKQAAVRALEKGVGKYTAVSGTPDLRKAAAEELNGAHGTSLAAENLIVSVGAKHSLFNLFLALLDAGDEVIIPKPCWVSYPEIVQMAEGTPVLLPTKPEDDWQFDADRLAITHCYFLLTRSIRACCTFAGTRPVMSPPNCATSFTSDDET